MERSRKLSCAIATILSGHSIALHAATTDAAGEGNDIQEITVTAQRRTENLQDVPITIQALTAETLTQLNVATFDDFIKYLPNVTSPSNGPGQGDIIIRGLGTTTATNQGAGAVGSFPNVAVYLDEQAGQLPGRNLDVYAADLERIEVLEGPQGTLFGAGAQAGVVRYITNKPKLDVTEGNVDAGYATTAHGDPSSNVQGTINIPLIADTLAVRAVIYDDTRGGYINNVPGTFTRADTDKGIVDYFGGVVPPNSPSINNSAEVGNAINPVTYEGIRASLLYKFNDDWNALLVQSYQDMDAQGVFYVTPENSALQPLPPLSVQLYNPSYDKDRFENTALTINGMVGPLKIIYAGGYLVRNVEQEQDYTNYSRGVYADYYECSGGGTSAVGAKPQCFSPSATWHETERATHESHEVRLSTPDDWRLRAIGGLYWEQYTVHDDTEWEYTSPEAGFNPLAPPTGAAVNDPNVRNANTSFFDDITRGYKQTAAFASVDYDIIPKTLTLTAGTRYFRFSNFEGGATAGSFGCRPNGVYSVNPVPDPCINVSNETNLTASNLHTTDTGDKSRLNLSWHATADALLYYTWSQGYRPGGFNRSSAVISQSSPLYGVFTPPLTYKPDSLVNNEIGWKTAWFDHRLEFNGAYYIEDWKNAQISIFDPGVTGNLTFTTNGPDYRVHGLETSVIARVTHGLTVTGAAAWNTGRLVNEPHLVGNDGQPLAENPYGALGSPLAQSPPFEGNLRVRYDFNVGDYKAFWQVGGTHQAHSYATTDRLTNDLQGNSIAYDQPGFSTYDASFGVAKDAWLVTFYGQNLTNTVADLFSTYGQWVKADTINRPRTMGLKFSYKF